MSDTTHTPGPWRVDEAHGAVIIRDARDGWVATVHGIVSRRKSDFEEANAHLIAAAPDLYDALRVCAEQLAHCLGPDTEAGRAAQAALARAEGR